MELKLNVGKNGFSDIKKLVSHITEKNRVIKAAPERAVSAVFPINEHAKMLHPDYQTMKVTDIAEHTGADAKTFTLSADKAAYFRAGQYLSVSLNIGGSIVTRPYSISSAPSLSKDGKYKITVRRTQNGFVSDYLLSEIKVGDTLTVSEPLGNFFYEELRDSKNVIAIAGGSGITPFLSMAHAVCDGTENFDLTILYGNKTEQSILFKNELDDISARCPRVKTVYVLSDEEKDGCEHGFITAEIISKYAPENKDCSVFMCGPEAMYRFAEKELAKLGIDRKHLRRELLGVTKNVSANEDYPAECKGKTFSATVKTNTDEKTIPVSADEPILVAIERAGIATPSRCRSGECGWCRSKLLSGNVYVPKENDEGRRFSDKETGYIHPCATFALSDIVIEVPSTYVNPAE